MRSMKKRRMIGQCSSSSSDSATPGWTYEVFVSFTGVDTRNNFVSHLYDALIGAGIATFKDDLQLDKGKPIGPELLKAIEKSRFAVVVFSKHYADSSWCLDELAKIVECERQFGMVVYPVFYDVDPSQVRKQTGDYGAALKNHKARVPDCKLQKWRAALTKAANDLGWDVAKTANGNESHCVKLIVQKILSMEVPYDVENLFGLESHLLELEKMLTTSGKDSDDVRIIGLWGPGGIGKTTITQAVYRKISHRFDGCCFVDCVRENGSNNSRLQSLQKKILSKILMDKSFKLWSLQDGIKEMSSRLRNKKVLLVLDDVDNADHLEALAATPDWFGQGSRILMTTRDLNVLPSSAQVYEPHHLHQSDGIQLFCMHAFQQKSPLKGYEELSDKIVYYANGLPLALKVLGSFMKGIKDMEEWRSAIGSLGAEPHSKIHNVLKLSYDGLSYIEQQVFLDVACFFKGQNKELVTRILDSCGNSSYNQSAIAIRVLIRKSLLIDWNGELHMHDLIQEMGWHIVRQSSTNKPKEPKECSRLWHHNDICHVLTDTTVNNVIQSIMLDTNEEVNINLQALNSMKELKFLDVRKAIISAKPTCLPDKLRWLTWNYYPFKSLPTGFRDLSGIHMLQSKLQSLWVGRMELPKLKFINLTGSSLERFPDISGAPNVERLILEDCCNLVEVHPTVGKLKKLVFLNLRSCVCLGSLPPFIGMESLETLSLSWCKMLFVFPMISGNMQRLSEIYMDHSSIYMLHQSFGNLSGLKVLVLASYSSGLPNTILSLRARGLCHYDIIPKLPKNIGSMESLEKLSVSSITEIPRSFSFLKNMKWFSIYSRHLSRASVSFMLNCLSSFSSLRKLYLGGLKDLESYLPDDLSAWSSLETLHIVDNSLIHLPASICRLPLLKTLQLKNCPELVVLQELPPNIKILDICDCSSLMRIANLSTRYEWLYCMSFTYCYKLVKHQLTSDYMTNQWLPSRLQGHARKHQFGIRVHGKVIPDWFTQQDFGTGVETVSVRPNWQRNIIGFAVCNIYDFWSRTQGKMLFKITDDMEPETKSASSLNKDRKGKHVMRIHYMSFDFLRRVHNNLKLKHWYLTRGSLVIRIPLLWSVQCASCMKKT